MVVITSVSVHLQAMLACVEVVFLVVRSVFSLFPIYIAYKACSANRAFDDSAELVLMLKIMLLLKALCCCSSLLFGKVEFLFRYDGIMFPIINREFILFNDMVFVSRTLDFFVLPSAVSNLSAINRIIDYSKA